MELQKFPLIQSESGFQWRQHEVEKKTWVWESEGAYVITNDPCGLGHDFSPPCISSMK